MIKLLAQNMLTSLKSINYISGWDFTKHEHLVLMTN